MRAAKGALLLLFALALAGARAAEEPVTLNFVNADIEAVAATIGQMTQRNFLIDPRVKGTVNIVSSRPVPASAAYDMFLSALRLQGYATVEGDGVVKILPEADAKLHLRSVAPRSADGDRLVTRVYALKYESASQLLPVLRPIISPNNPVAVYAPNNTLVITDYADNLRRIDRIIDAIDRPGTGGEPVLLPLRHAAAADIVAMVNRVYSDGAAAQRRRARPRHRGRRFADQQRDRARRQSGAPPAHPGNGAAPRLAHRRRRQHPRGVPEERGSRARGADAARGAFGRARADAGRFGGAARHGAGRPWAAGRRRSRPGAGELGGIGRLGRGRRHGPGRRGLERRHHLGARRRLCKPAGRDRQARRAPRPGACRGPDRRDYGGQGGRVRRPVAVAAQPQHQRHAGDRRHQLRRARLRHQYSRRARPTSARSGRG